MSRSVPLLVLSAPIFLAVVSAADPPKSKAPILEVIGLEIRRALPDEKEEVARLNFPGTNVELFAALPDRYVICCDADQSRIDSFADDLGTDLTKPQPGRRTGGAGVVPFGVEQVSRDGRRCQVTLRAASVPAKDARKITVKGTLVLKCGSDEKTVQTADVDLPGQNEKMKVGEYTLSGGFFPDSGGDLSLYLECPTANVKTVTIFGPDSKELKPTFGNLTKRPGTFDGGKYHQFITVPKPGGKVTVRVTYFNKVEDVPLPVDLTVGLGL